MPKWISETQLRPVIRVQKSNEEQLFAIPGIRVSDFRVFLRQEG
jgi:hypothetical protein